MRDITKEQKSKLKSKWVHDRATKGYCEYDSYEVGSWFLDTAPFLIDTVEEEMRGTVMESYIDKYLKDNFKTYHLTYDEYSKMPFESKKGNKIFNICVKEYHKMLKEMSHCLMEANPELCSKKNEYEKEYYAYIKKYWKVAHKQCSIKQDDGSILINTGDSRLKAIEKENKELNKKYHKRDKEIRKYQLKNRERGLTLFVKYFEDLAW